jgi:protein-S-isoprenylcysteine O-methyltransferase Ste14
MEQDVVDHQSAKRQNLDREEVGCRSPGTWPRLRSLEIASNEPSVRCEIHGGALDVAFRLTFVLWQGSQLFLNAKRRSRSPGVSQDRGSFRLIAVDVGPYRLVRHPSYAGMLLALFGFVLALGNWAGLFAMLVLAAAAFAYRITVEEAALLSTLGEPYARYMRRL